MEDLVKSGKAKAIGVCNFSRKEIERLIANATIKPAVHQMELHPWLQQSDFYDFHRTHGIHVTQYSPFGDQNQIYGAQEKYGQLINDETLVEIGKKYGKTSAQVALGILPLLARFRNTELITFHSLGYRTWPFRHSEIKASRTDQTKLWYQFRIETWRS